MRALFPVIDIKPEKTVQAILRNLNIDFKTHVPISYNGICHQVDILLLNSKDAIEVARAG